MLSGTCLWHGQTGQAAAEAFLTAVTQNAVMLFTEWKALPSTFGTTTWFIQYLLSHFFQRESFRLRKIRKVLQGNGYLL